MIVSVSRRTDIPAFYSDWFFRRLQEGYALVRSPYNPRQISRVNLSPDAVDGFVFWTKNPAPMEHRLQELHAYPYYFQFTLTAYGPEMEPGLPSKNRILIPLFQRLAQMVGPERIIWRYDPILLNGTYSVPYHIKYFRVLAAKLSGCTRKCVISFLDSYRHLSANMRQYAMRSPTPSEREILLDGLLAAAQKHHIRLGACCESIPETRTGIEPGNCIDPILLSGSEGAQKFKADKHQRPGCTCCSSVDIGSYNTCPGGCRYCYATRRPDSALLFPLLHDPRSPLLDGWPGDEDKITDRSQPH